MNYQPGENHSKEDTKYYPELIERANDPTRFSGRNGILIDELVYGGVRGSMEITESLKNPMGGAHGGALTTLADTVAGVAVATRGIACVTLNNTMNYLREVRLGKVYCSAEIVKSGRTITVCDIKIVDEENRLVATGTFTFFMKGEVTSILE